MASQPQDQSRMSLLQEQGRREILERMQTSSIIKNETMDLEYLLDVAQQELALARATSRHVDIPEELVCSLQELIYRLGQSMQSVAEAPASPSDIVTVTVDHPPSSE
ncbi:hypothetical protein SKAU_G00214440 [Synaphobranchus kaupii]|uniref:Uncharacterized protein n=1 Tax=Synaphobranchus kaupii TaxID=118154 RepID=A0A9Q1F9Q4_SYNKA|nr:hypothetical protein SKAU_G00214440 [Synaphobranchus kaupii]